MVKGRRVGQARDCGNEQIEQVTETRKEVKIRKQQGELMLDSAEIH